MNSISASETSSFPQGNGAKRHKTNSTAAAEDGNKLHYFKSLPDLPDPIITNILSFQPNMTINKGLSESLLKSYKETIVKRLNVKKEMVDALENSDIIRLFHKLNDESTQAALTMGFSLKQIATIPSDQLSEYKTQFDAYDIPVDIQDQIDNLSETNGRLNLEEQGLTTGQLCKILKALTDDQRNALTELRLFNNQLTALPDSFGNLSALTQLYLENNQLTSLPDSFVRLTALTRLSLGNNQLTSLPDSFVDLRALTELWLQKNQLTSLPHKFGDLRALTVLSLHQNQLSTLPNSFGNLSALTELNLGKNQLSSLPGSFGRLTALTVLNLCFSQLASLPDSFGRLSALTVLRLYNNQLTSLPDSFGNLSALMVLNLDQNQLTSLPDSFKNLSALTGLCLHQTNSHLFLIRLET